VDETKLVVRGLPLRFAVAPNTKFVPVTVIETAEMLALSEDGEIEVTAGTLLFTVKLIGFDAPPPGDGFVTTTAKAPAVP
jgi:hypothetical protein